LERKNLWAPWRIKYIQGLSDSSKTGCFICHNQESPQDDDKNLVLWRTKKSIVIINRFPYNNGHLLIAPVRHIGELDQATDEELLEMIKLDGDTNFMSVCSDTKVISQSLTELLEQLKQVSKEHNLPGL